MAPPRPPPTGPVQEVRSPETVALTLASGVGVHFTPDAAVPDTSTLWSGAQAFRTRWRHDRASLGWASDGCIGVEGDDGDALRFDATSRALREVFLTRPTRTRVDDALLAAVAARPVARGALRLDDDVIDFKLAPMDGALFDVTLAHFVALRADITLAAVDGLRCVAVSPALSLLFHEGRYAGWRVDDPVAFARPMGWPEMRDPAPMDDGTYGVLRSLLYDWMVIDASPRVAPRDAASPDDIEHLVALRSRARALAEVPCDEHDPTAGVARDIAAYVHWSWGFFRVEA